MSERLLTAHFPLAEFLRSEYAVRHGRELRDPPSGVVANLFRLCTTCLEPLRVALGRPLVVLSGWRPQWLNEAVGGSMSSAHLYGRGADIVCPGMPPRELAGYITRHPVPFDQLILEFPPAGWVHIGIAPDGVPPRGEILTATKRAGITHYSEGLQ